MSPRKQPNSLFKLCVKSCISLIDSACYIIEKNCAERDFVEFKRQALSLKCHLMSILPARLFDILCLERTCCQYSGDPELQLHVLTHPNMTVFLKCDLDNSISQNFWIQNLPNFTRLIILDLKFVCTDEILHVIGANCHLLEEINIVSKVDIIQSHLNASVLIRNVSDNGLHSIINLRHLRILTMDPPRNERACKVGRCISQSGVIMLVTELPYLEELRMESCDIGSTLNTTAVDIGPLSLKKIKCHFVSVAGIKKLIKICPFLKELSITHLFANNKDAILGQLALSDLRLSRLDLSFFAYSESMRQLLAVKGSYLTHFTLWEMEHSLTLEMIVSIGTYCPNLNSLCLITQSKFLATPRYFSWPRNIFSQLQYLNIGNDNYDIDFILSFFFECTQRLKTLVLKYQTKKNIDNTLLQLLEKGCLKTLVCLWLDCTLEVSKDVVKKVIESCDHLTTFTVDITDDMNNLQRYIRENNLDVKLGVY